MILETILTLTGVTAIASIVNLFDKFKGSNNESISIKKYMPGDLPIITLYNNDTPFNFLLDTGSNICHICPSIVKNIKYNSIDKGNTETVGLGGKSVQSNNCKATFTDEKNREYSINLVISKEFEMSANSIEKCIGIKINGLLGTDFLQNYKYVIDFKTLEVHARR